MTPTVLVALGAMTLGVALGAGVVIGTLLAVMGGRDS